MSIVANRWALVPIAMIAATVAAGAVAVAIAVRDGAPVEPDSFRKGLSWDAHRAQIAQNGLLGWVLTTEVAGGGDMDGSAVLRIAVDDKHGMPIEGARVRAEAIPMRDADARILVHLAERSPGRYEAPCPLRISGQWEIRAVVEAKGMRYADSIRRFVEFTAAGAASRERRR